ncbi:transposase [Streptomyces sp. I5]|uniref:transposase n=1 Tax=Streptomyces sp. I5 TaxID=2759947 RepID=UPI0035A8DEFD
MVAEIRPNCPTEWAAMKAVAAKLGVGSAETVRTRVRRTSPIEYSSGRRRTRRLNYGGDRQANAVLHRIVFTRLRHDPRTQAYYERRTQAYYERRTQEGKTRREIIRCLKRYAAREVFNLVRPVSLAPAL